jgi:hypothetical protein
MTSGGATRMTGHASPLEPGRPARGGGALRANFQAPKKRGVGEKKTHLKCLDVAI